MTLTTGDARRPRMPTPSVGERKGARAMMTPKQKLEMHRQIVRANKAKLEAWRQSMRKAGAAK